MVLPRVVTTPREVSQRRFMNSSSLLAARARLGVLVLGTAAEPPADSGCNDALLSGRKRGRRDAGHPGVSGAVSLPFGGGGSSVFQLHFLVVVRDDNYKCLHGAKSMSAFLPFASVVFVCVGRCPSS